MADCELRVRNRWFEDSIQQHNTAFIARMFAMPATCIHNEITETFRLCLPTSRLAAFATSLQRPRGSLRLKEPGKYDDRVVQHPATFSVSAFTYIQRSRRVFPVAIGLHRGKKGSRRVRFGEKTSLRSCAEIGTRTKFSGGSR